MISALGRAAVLLALGACAVGAVTGIAGAARGSGDAARLSRGTAYLFFAAMAVAVGLMEFALVTHDVSVSYVAEVGSLSTPLWVTIVSLWSSLEGSILLWAFVLSAYTAAFAWTSRTKYPEYAPWAVGMAQAVGVFFCFLVAGVANPFLPISPVPTDGPGPNPLLQNHLLMVVHPVLSADPDQWGPEFTPILSSSDKGEEPKKGGLLVAKYGKGYYIYTGLSFFRELPEGVSGAYRLMANLIGLGK